MNRRWRIVTLGTGVGLVFLTVASVWAQVQIQVRQPVLVGRSIRPAPTATAAPKPTLTDAQALEAARLDASNPAPLLDYFRQRTLNDQDLTRIQAVIQRLGAADFDDRLQAAQEVEGFGPAAVGPLRAAKADKDPEIAYRAGECLKRMEKVPHTAVARAAARALAKLQPEEAAGVLIKFLPLSDSEEVSAEIRLALKALAFRGGKADPALIAALKDTVAVRRSASAVALIEGSPSHQHEAYTEVLAAAKRETDVETRFQMLFSLLTVAREKSAVGEIIEALPTLPRGRMWQAEDFLLQLAGDNAPKAVLGKTKESLKKAQDAWKAWWQTASTQIDLAKTPYTPRIAGKTILVMMDFRYGSMGEIVELGPDMNRNWKIGGLNSPMDVDFLKDGSVVVAEHNSNRVTIRDPKTNKTIANRTIGGANRVYGNPQQVQVLDNGNLLVTCRNVIVEFKKDKDEEAMRFVRNNYDIAAAHRLPDGQTVVLLQNGPNHCIFLDAKGKEVKERTLKVQMPYYQAYIDQPTKDTLLLTEMNRVVEYNLKDGKEVWKKIVNQPRSVQRLPNGNTLIVDAQSNKVVEYTPDGEDVWSYQPASGYNVFRAFRK
ncbi:MAG: PQQ-binding-like beta-propeller repeat protein [Bacteroidales bacterium]|nr:PQQ-binding-like beta-propeller repeat protein [Bacteroidales bacterium]